MATLIGSLCRDAVRSPDTPLNILTFPTHERFQSNLAYTGHNFYLWRGQGIKDWNTTYAPLPSNHCLLSGEIPVDLDLDLVLSQNKAGQFPVAYHFARKYHLPLITLEHTLPTAEIARQLDQVRSMSGHIDVFISEYSRKAWNWPENKARVIHHGVDTDLFCSRLFVEHTQQTPHILSVVNDFANRDWCCGFNLWRELTTGLPVKLLGDNPGLSEPAKSVDDLVKAYQRCTVFLNTSLISPVPTVLLEAMACGAPVVSTATCMIPEIIEHGINGFISNDQRELRNYVELLLEDTGLAMVMGANARQTIFERFSLSAFVNNWNSVFNLAKDIIYTGDFSEAKFIVR